MAISQAVRRRVWTRDKGVCGRCHEPVAFAEMDLDHIIPSADGGTDDEANLRPTHRTCNRGGSAAARSLQSPRREHVGAAVQIVARLRYPLYARLKAAAAQEGASLVTWVTAAIEERLERQERSAHGGSDGD
jgi:hypothetical protein